jgi:hypothetical protein
MKNPLGNICYFDFESIILRQYRHAFLFCEFIFFHVINSLKAKLAKEKAKVHDLGGSSTRHFSRSNSWKSLLQPIVKIEYLNNQ